MFPHIRVTSRFFRAYHAIDPDRQQKAESEVHQFIRRYEANPLTVAQTYVRIEHLHNCRDNNRSQVQVLEMKFTSGDRILASWQPPCLTLLEIGDHRTTGSLKCAELKRLLCESQDAPNQFRLGQRPSLFKPNPSGQWVTYGSELTPQWVYFLDAQQAIALETIYENSLVTLLTEGYYQVHLIVGGPGTGKTCILLNLLKLYFDAGIDVRLSVSSEVRAYLKSASSVDFDAFCVELRSNEQLKCDVLLVDDPSSISQLERTISYGRTGNVKIVVLAFDPLQLDKALSDKEYQQFRGSHTAWEHTLSTCYRQKENVGLVTKDAIDTIARSAPFYVEEKKQDHWQRHQAVTALSNGLTFVNPYGYTQLYEDAQLANLQTELDRVKRQPGGLWRHWYPLMVALIDKDLQTLPPRWLQILSGSGINFRVVNYELLCCKDDGYRVKAVA